MADVCKAPECTRDVDTSNGGARGLCARCYQRKKRRTLGKPRGTMPGQDAYAAPGEGAGVSFRFPRVEKTAFDAHAKRLKVEPSELWRRAGRELLERLDGEARARKAVRG